MVMLIMRGNTGARCPGSRFHVPGMQVQVSGFMYQVCSFQVPGASYIHSRCQIPSVSFQVPGTRQPGTMCQVSGIRCNAKTSKTFTLKVFCISAEIKNLSYVSTEITNLQTLFSPCFNIFFMQFSKLFIVTFKIKAHFLKIKKKTQLSAM